MRIYELETIQPWDGVLKTRLAVLADGNGNDAICVEGKQRRTSDRRGRLEDLA